MPTTTAQRLPLTVPDNQPVQPTLAADEARLLLHALNQLRLHNLRGVLDGTLLPYEADERLAAMLPIAHKLGAR